MDLGSSESFRASVRVQLRARSKRKGESERGGKHDHITEQQMNRAGQQDSHGSIGTHSSCARHGHVQHMVAPPQMLAAVRMQTSLAVYT